MAAKMNNKKEFTVALLLLANISGFSVCNGAPNSQISGRIQRRDAEGQFDRFAPIDLEDIQDHFSNQNPGQESVVDGFMVSTFPGQSQPEQEQLRSTVFSPQAQQQQQNSFPPSRIPPPQQQQGVTAFPPASGNGGAGQFPPTLPPLAQGQAGVPPPPQSSNRLLGSTSPGIFDQLKAQIENNLRLRSQPQGQGFPSGGQPPAAAFQPQQPGAFPPPSAAGQPQQFGGGAGNQGQFFSQGRIPAQFSGGQGQQPPAAPQPTIPLPDGSKSFFDSIVTRINQGHRENARQNQNRAPEQAASSPAQDNQNNGFPPRRPTPTNLFNGGSGLPPAVDIAAAVPPTNRFTVESAPGLPLNGEPEITTRRPETNGLDVFGSSQNRGNAPFTAFRNFPVATTTSNSFRTTTPQPQTTPFPIRTTTSDIRTTPFPGRPSLTFSGSVPAFPDRMAVPASTEAPIRSVPNEVPRSFSGGSSVGLNQFSDENRFLGPLYQTSFSEDGRINQFSTQRNQPQFLDAEVTESGILEDSAERALIEAQKFDLEKLNESEADRQAQLDEERLQAQLEAERRRKADEELRKQRLKLEEERVRQAEEEARKFELEIERRQKDQEEEKRKLAEEIERKRIEEEKRKIAEELDRRRKLAEETQRKKEEEENRRRQEEEERRRLFLEEQRRREIEEERRREIELQRRKEIEEKARKEKEEEERKEQEERARKALEEQKLRELAELEKKIAEQEARTRRLQEEVREREEQERLRQIRLQEEQRSQEFDEMKRRENAIKNAAEAVRRKVEKGEGRTSPAVWAAVKSLTEFLDAEPKADSIPNPVLMAIIQLTNYLESEESETEPAAARPTIQTTPAPIRQSTARQTTVQPLRQSAASRVRQPAAETASQRPPRRFVKKFKVVGRGENRELIPAGGDSDFPLLRQFNNNNQFTGSTTTRRPRLRFDTSRDFDDTPSSAQLRLDNGGGASPELLQIRDALLNKGSLRFENSKDEKFDVRILGSEGHLEPLLQTAASQQPITVQIVEESNEEPVQEAKNTSEELEVLDLLNKFTFENLPIRR